MLIKLPSFSLSLNDDTLSITKASVVTPEIPVELPKVTIVAVPDANSGRAAKHASNNARSVFGKCNRMAGMIWFETAG